MATNTPLTNIIKPPTKPPTKPPKALGPLSGNPGVDFEAVAPATIIPNPKMINSAPITTASIFINTAVSRRILYFFSTPDGVAGAPASQASGRGLRAGDKIFLLGREIKLVFRRFASLDHPGADSYDVSCSSHPPTWRQPRQQLITV